MKAMKATKAGAPPRAMKAKAMKAMNAKKKQANVKNAKNKRANVKNAKKKQANMNNQDDNESWVTINTKGFQEVLVKLWTETIHTRKGKTNTVPRLKYYRLGHGEAHGHSHSHSQ